MNLDITLLPNGHVHEVFPYLIPFIKKAEPFALGRLNADDIAALMFSRSVQTWLVFDQDTNEIHGYLTTEIRQYPNSKNLCVLNCGGRDGSLDACVHKTFELFEKYARAQGCDGLEFQGRRAWKKFAEEHDIEAAYTQYFKDLRG